MNWTHLLTVYRKELRDMLRDRRSLISMIVVPTLVMPGLIGLMAFLSLRVAREAASATPTVMILGGEDSPRVVAALRAGLKVELVPSAPDWRTRIADKRLRAALEIPPGFDRAVEQGGKIGVRIYHHAGEMRSSFAAGELRRFLAEHGERIVVARLAERGLPASALKPFAVNTENVAPPEKVGGGTIGGLIPYFFLLLSFTGAMYPAMDLTAGEKERGTLETLLCSPVARLDLVLGKFLTILTASLGTVACSMVSLGCTVIFGGPLLAQGVANAGTAGARQGAAQIAAMTTLDPLGLVAVLGMVFPLAVLFSAVLFAVSLCAKSFKEAQTYVSPLIALVLLPAIIGSLPGMELNNRLALVPILNVSLVSKELVAGVWPWTQIVLIFGSSCLYAAAALGVAVRLFQRESVIFRT